MMHGVVVAQSVHCGVSMWSCGVTGRRVPAVVASLALPYVGHVGHDVGAWRVLVAARRSGRESFINEIRSVNIARGLNRFESEFLPSYENRQCARPGLGLGVHRARGVAHRPEG
jgi:hypothetical protein